MKVDDFDFPPYIETSGPYSRRYYGGGGGGQTSTTNTTQAYNPEEAARRAKLMAEAERIYGDTAANVTTMAPGGPSADTTAAQNLTRQQATGPMADLTAKLPGALNFGFSSVLDPTNTPGFQATLDTATRKIGNAYTDPGGVFSNIRTGSISGSEGGTSSRQGIAEGIAGREYLNTVGDVTGRLTSDAYSKGLDTFSRTLALTPQTMTAMQQPANMLSATGAQTEAYDEQQRQWQMNAPWAALAPYANVVQGTSNPTTTSIATSPGAKTGPLNALGAAGAGASIGFMIGGPMGAGVGAGAGLLATMFS